MQANASIPALEALATAYGHFEGEAHDALVEAEYEIRATEEWLQERRTYWQAEVERCERAVAAAEAALSACLASGAYDPETGAYYPPDCSAEESALLQAREELARARHELANVEQWIDIVMREATAYRDQAGRASRVTGEVLSLGRSFLVAKAADLRAFVTGGQG